MPQLRHPSKLPFSFRPPDHVGISCFEGRQAEAMIAKDARSTELSSAEGSGTPLSAGRRGTGCALRIAVLSIGQRHSLRVGPGCRPAQRKFRTSRMPSRADVRGEFFFALVMFHSHGDKPPINTRTCRTGSGPRLRGTYTIPTLNHISPWASPCRPQSLPPLMG